MTCSSAQIRNTDKTWPTSHGRSASVPDIAPKRGRTRASDAVCDRLTCYCPPSGHVSYDFADAAWVCNETATFYPSYHQPKPLCHYAYTPAPYTLHPTPYTPNYARVVWIIAPPHYNSSKKGITVRSVNSNLLCLRSVPVIG